LDNLVASPSGEGLPQVKSRVGNLLWQVSQERPSTIVLDGATAATAGRQSCPTHCKQQDVSITSVLDALAISDNVALSLRIWQFKQHAAIDARAAGIQLLALRRAWPYASKQPTPKNPGWTCGSSGKPAPARRLEVSAAQCATRLPQPDELQRLRQHIAACALGAKIAGNLNRGSSPLLSVNDANKERGGLRNGLTNQMAMT